MQETYYGLSGVWDSIREKEIQGVPVHHCKPSVYRREPEGADGFVRGRGDDCQQAQWALPDRGQGGGKVSFKQAVAGTEGGDYPAVKIISALDRCKRHCVVGQFFCRFQMAGINTSFCFLQIDGDIKGIRMVFSTVRLPYEIQTRQTKFPVFVHKCL